MYRKMPQLAASGNTPRSTYNETFRESLYNPSQAQQQQQQFVSQSLQDLSMSASYPSKNSYSQAPQTNAYSPPKQQQFQYPTSSSQQAPILPPISLIEREAHIRNLKRMDSNSNSMNGFDSASSNFNLNSAEAANHKMMLRSKNEQELNRISNKLYNDNAPSDRNPNTPFWFGRTGSYNSSKIHQTSLLVIV